jgi:hypothetical protein
MGSAVPIPSFLIPFLLSTCYLIIYNMTVVPSRIKILIVAFLIISFSLPTLSFGAEIGVLESDISVSIAPENPKPYDDMTITLTSYATDLNKALIEWRSGKDLLLSGYGKTSYSFKALGPNTPITLNVNITPVGSDKVSKQIVVNASEITMLWEGADSYTPPFYRGKSFVSREGSIRVVAIPETNTIKSGKGNIAYTWKSGDNTILSASGYNKDSYVFRNSNLNTSENISVQASSIDGRYDASDSIQIPIIDPKIVFYKKSPTEGVLYADALTSETTFEGDEMTIVAEPYFFSLNQSAQYITYGWQINGKAIDTPLRKTELTVHPASRGGYANVSLVIENLNSLFQKVSASLKLNL